MKKLLRFISAVLCVIMLVATVSPSQICAKEQTEYNVMVDDTEMYFNFGWFNESSYKFNQELCLASIVMSTRVGSQWSVKRTLGAIGFTRFSFSPEFDDTYNENGTHAAFAIRTVNNGGNPFTVIAVTFSGTSEEEWLGNFNIGTGDMHHSFAAAANDVKKLLDTYISSAGNESLLVGTVKLYLLGHSRGAAVANVLAAMLTESREYTSPENIFTYTSATPNVTTRADAFDDKYNNIFNIVNPEDFISQSPPSAWGYRKFGITYNLPTVIDKDTLVKTKYYDEILAAVKYYNGGSDYEYYKRGPIDVDNMLNSINYACQNSIEGFTKKVYDLSSVIPTSLADKYNLHYYTTVSDFCNSIIGVIAGKTRAEVVQGSVLLAAIHPAFFEAVKFFVFNIMSPDELCSMLNSFLEAYPELKNYITLEDLKPLIDESSSRALIHAHMNETYAGWISVISPEDLNLADRSDNCSLTKDVRICTPDGLPLGDFTVELIPFYSNFFGSSIAIGSSIKLDNVRRVRWSSNSLLVSVDEKGIVRCNAFFPCSAIITLTVTTDERKTYTDSVKVAFCKNDRQLDNICEESFSHDYSYLTQRQYKLIWPIFLKLLNIIFNTVQEKIVDIAG